jgi:hypothetical protein
MFRVSSESEHCRFVVAGFTELMREPQRVDSPFFKKTFEWIRMSPFAQGDVRDVVLTPMRSLGVEFINADEIVSRIHHQTGGIPLLVQYYCLSLVSVLDDTLRRQVDPRSLGEISYRPGIIGHVIGPLKNSVDASDQLLIYAMLLNRPAGQDAEPFTREDILTAMQDVGFPRDLIDLNQSCDRLVLAGILTRSDGGYRFLIPMLPRFLRQENLPHLVSEAKRRIGL